MRVFSLILSHNKEQGELISAIILKTPSFYGKMRQINWK